MHRASGGGYASASKALPVTVRDDDTAAVVLTPPSIAVNEGDASGTGYTVKLSHEPTATVTVAVAGHGGTDLSISGTALDASDQLTFTTSNWATAQAVTVKAAQDQNAVSESLKLTHTPSGGGYSTAADLPVNVNDDDTAAIVLAPTSLSVTEGDTTGVSYTVKLATQPSTTVTVAIGGHSGADLTVSGAALSSDELTFTTSNWGTAQTVTVKAGDDENASNESETLTHTASGGDYAGVSRDLPVTVNDDDTAAIVLTPTSLSVTEGDTTGVSYTVKLATQPSTTVTVAIGGHSGTNLTVSSSRLTFTTSNWDTAQTVTVKAGEDENASNESETLTHTASGGDYVNVTRGLPVAVEDDDTAAVVLTPESIAVNEGDAAGTGYTVKLSHEPTATVTVAIGGHTGTDLSISGTELDASDQLTFTTSNWAAAQTVTVKAAQDENAVSESLKLTHTPSGGGYASASKALPVTVEDDDTAAIVLTPESIAVNEGDAAGTGYTVKLSHEPTATVTVAIGGHTGTNLSISGTALDASDQLTFTTSNWATAQAVTVKAAQDQNAVSESLKLTHTPSGGGYSTAADLTVTVNDDETAAIVLSETSLTVTEGDTTGVGYTVKLATQPTASVTVTIGGHSGTDLTVSSSQLSFTTSNWGTAQTVTVKAGEDENALNESETLTHTASGGDYAGVSRTLPVTVEDDDTAAVVLTPPSIAVNEGDASGTGYTVKLSHEPTATVTVAVAGHGGTDLSISGTALDASDQLTFTTSNWATAQAVTVNAAQDQNAVSESLKLTHTPSGGGYSTAADLTMTVNDDETAAIVLSETSLTVTEGDTTGVGYTVKLATQPTASVTVTIGGHSGTGLTVSGAALSSNRLTFTTSTWGTAQTVTVKAGEDENASNESETLTHTASGGDYAGVSRDLPVAVEDDAPGTVAVSFGAAAYTVVEGSSRSITLSLDADPERRVVIPIDTGNEGGASGSDYTGVPENVIFNSGETEQSFTLSATEDNLVESGEKVKLSFGTLPSDATADTPSEATVSIHDRTQGQNLPTQPSVHFESAAYTVAEGSSVAVKVILSKAPGSDVVIPISEANRAGADDGDYTGVPDTLTFGATDTEKIITFAATDDEVDDDGERVKLSFGTLLGGITATSGGAAEATVSITDNDDATAKAIVVSPTSLTVTEEDTTGTSYTAKLSTAPMAGVTVAITGHDGTDLTLSSDQLTFTTSNWDTAQTVTVKAGADADPFDESETLVHRASGGGYASASKTLPVTVRDDDEGETEIDCNSAVWCAELEFTTSTPPSEMWSLKSRSIDSEFDFNGITYGFGGLSVAPYGHNIPISSHPNPPFAIPERTKFSMRLLNMNASGYSFARFQMPNDDWMDWTLHVSTTKDGETLTAALPFSEARFAEYKWFWFGSDLEALRAAWTEGQVYKLKIMEDPRSERTPQVLGPPLYLEVYQSNGHDLSARWKMPATRDDRLHPNTSYKVQWKAATGSWNIPADVSEEIDSPSPARGETSGHVIKGLTEVVEYHVRVIATNPVGDSEPSDVISATPTTPQATSQSQVAENTPAEGALGIEGAAEVGQTLSADTTNITDFDGLTNAVFAYQWLADDVVISGAMSSAYAPDSGDVGKAIKVRVDFNDDAGNVESLTSAPTAAVTAADLALQSATVDRSTLTLTYNATLDVRGTLSKSAFTVNVNGAERTIFIVGRGGTSVLLTLSSAVESGDTVTVAYAKPNGANVIKDTDGNEAGSFSAQAVTNNTAAPAESGEASEEQDDAPGSPSNLKVAVHESGKLRASWDAPGSGPAPTGYTVQWKKSGDNWDDAADVSETDLTGTSHIITGLTDGTEYAVRVMARKGDAASDPSGEVTATPRETTAPALSSASVDGATLTLAFNESLDTGGTPDNSAFTVSVAGASRGVSTVSVSGSAVALTLATAVAADDEVTVGYAAPADQAASRLQDLAGNAAASFTAQAVTNNTEATESGEASEEQDDAPGSPSNLKLAVHESGKLRASWDAPGSGPAPTGYTVQWKESGDNWDDAADVSETDVSGTSHIITGLTDGTEYTVRVKARKGDVAGDPSGEVTATPRETTAPALLSASVDGDSLTLAFDESLDTGGTPDNSAFTVSVAGASRGLSTVSVSGSAVTLTLATAVAADDEVTVGYAAPADQATSRLQDLAGNAAASFAAQAVTNSTAPLQGDPEWSANWSPTSFSEGTDSTLTIQQTNAGASVPNSTSMVVTVHVGRSEGTADPDDVTVKDHEGRGLAAREMAATSHHDGGWIYITSLNFGEAKTRTLSVGVLNDSDGSETLAVWVYVNGHLAKQQTLTLTPQ